jgi:hypothetical protein
MILNAPKVLRFAILTIAQCNSALYLAGGARAFEEGRMGVDQILAVRPAAAAETGPRS